MVGAGHGGDVATAGNKRQPGTLGAGYASCGLRDDLFQHAGFKAKPHRFGASNLIPSAIPAKKLAGRS